MPINIQFGKATDIKILLKKLQRSVRFTAAFVVFTPDKIARFSAVGYNQ
ncbi:MAG: hypothetical protein ACI4MH_00650 [Candidatus Coproplasma sp.]